MENVNFTVSKDETTKRLSVNVEKTIEELKNLIKTEYNITQYIDIDFRIEKPMRVLGKFNVEPGILARTFDRYELNKFGIKGDIELTFNIVHDYEPHVLKKKTIDVRKYSVIKEETTSKFDINSEDEFPKLC